MNSLTDFFQSQRGAPLAAFGSSSQPSPCRQKLKSAGVPRSTLNRARRKIPALLLSALLLSTACVSFSVTAFAADIRASPQDAEVTALLDAVAKRRIPDYLRRDTNGNVVAINLHRDLANDRNLAIVSRLNSVRDLTIQGTAQKGDFTRQGILHLAKLTNLVTLKVCCIGMLESGVFQEISTMGGLRQLHLIGACPPTAEYHSLTNLQNLTELHLTHCTNFGAGQVSILTNLVNLRSLTLFADAFSDRGTNVLANMTSLTNVDVRPAR